MKLNEKEQAEERGYCSQCGMSFGPGEHGFSRCSDHNCRACGATREGGKCPTGCFDGYCTQCGVDIEGEGCKWCDECWEKRDRRGTSIGQLLEASRRDAIARARLAELPPSLVTTHMAGERNKMKLNEKEQEWVRSDYQEVPQEEFDRFLWRCEQAGLNPLLGHARLQGRRNGKTGKMTYTLLVQRDGLRTIADQSEKLDGIKTVANFEEGKLVSATAWVWRKDKAHPFETTAFLNEYQEGEYLWRTKPATMICKVAEVAALRMAFPVMEGLYSEEEMEGEWMDKETGEIKPPPKSPVTPPKAPTKMPESMHRALEAMISKSGISRVALHQYLVEVGWLEFTETGPHLTDLSATRGSYILGNWDKLVDALGKWESKSNNPEDTSSEESGEQEQKSPEGRKDF